MAASTPAGAGGLEDLFGPAEAPAEEGGDGEFHDAFVDFIAAYEANDLESAEAAFKQAVKACYAAEESESAELMPPV